jgi:hypothetical protein
MSFEFKRDAEGRALWHAPLPHPSGEAVIDGRPAFGPCQLCGEKWPCAEARYDAGPIAIGGVWLRGSRDDGVEVLVEVDGHWRVVIRDDVNEIVSNIVEPLGIRHAQDEPS